MGINVKNIIPYLWSVLFGNHEPAGNHEPPQSPSGITIAFVGSSGSGMSTLIHDATGSYETGVAPDEWRSKHLTEPYTDNIQYQGYTIPGVSHTDFPLIFIDTPGFTSWNQNKVHTALRDLSEWLRKYKPRTRLDGLVFVHNVSADKLHNQPPYIPPRDNIMMKLCGPNWPQKVVFVTSHWDQLREAEHKNVQAQLENYWSVMQKFPGAPGLQKYDHPDTPGSVWEILRPLVKNALDFRKKKLSEELDSLRERSSSSLYEHVKEAVDGKMDFMQRLISRLGRSGTAEILTDEECDLYKRLTQKSVQLWKDVENELDMLGIAELEHLLTTELTGDSDKIKKLNIGVVGSIRSGKSQFIYNVTNQREEYIASESDMHPHTEEFNDTASCMISAAELNSQFDYLVTLIDTPGFDYLRPDCDEKKGFEKLLNWTWKRYGGLKLDGMIYLHSVQYEELGARNSLYTFSQPLRDIWHEEWLRRMVFVSSFWSQNENGQNMSTEVMENRERGIRASYCNSLADVRMMRYDGKSDGGDTESARDILVTVLLQFL